MDNWQGEVMWHYDIAIITCVQANQSDHQVLDSTLAANSFIKQFMYLEQTPVYDRI